jgi:hypothetical protein
MNVSETRTSCVMLLRFAACEGMSTYQYKDLPANAIRLLNLSPGKIDDDLQCSLLEYGMCQNHRILTGDRHVVGK